jgi:hypothetical protein
MTAPAAPAPIATDGEKRRTRSLMALALALNAPLAIGFLVGLGRDLASPTAVVASDFSVFWTGWWLILHGQGHALYDAATQRAAQHLVMGGRQFEGGLMAFLNPPHVALAGLPFGWLADRAGERAAFLAWTAVNLGLLVRLDRGLRALLGAERGRARWMVTASLLGFYPVLYAVSIGQLSLLLAVAALELERALAAGRPWRAAAWIVVLSCKPQLASPVLALLAARRRWAVLGRAAVIAGALAALTAVVLGPSIWPDYFRSVRGLERFFGTGTPAYMMNVRAALTRLLGRAASPDAVYAAAAAAWAAALGALALALARRPTAGESAARAELAVALAVGLLFSPHLFAQDATLWAVALALHVAALRARGEPWRRFAAFAFTWPLLFALVRVVDLGGGRGPSLRIDPAVAAMAVAVAAMSRARFGRAVTTPR